MERHAIDDAGAFELLRERSRVDNRKLIDLATAVVDGHRLLPGPPAASRSPEAQPPPNSHHRRTRAVYDAIGRLALFPRQATAPPALALGWSQRLDRHDGCERSSVRGEESSCPPFRTRPLTPLRFLERSAEVYPDKVAIVHGDRRMTYREFAGEATRLARALQASGIEPGDRVAYLCPNIPELLIAHFAVPLAGAVLVAINSRLAGQEVSYICEHSGRQAAGGRLGVALDRHPGAGPARGGPGDRHRSPTRLPSRTFRKRPRAPAIRTCSSVDPTSRWAGRSRTSWPRSRSTTPRGPPGSPRA